MYLLSKLLERLNVYQLMFPFIRENKVINFKELEELEELGELKPEEIFNVIVDSPPTIYYKYVDEVVEEYNYPEFVLIRYPDYGFVSSVIIHNMYKNINILYPTVLIYVMKSTTEDNISYIIFNGNLYRWHHLKNILYVTNEDNNILMHFRERPDINK